MMPRCHTLIFSILRGLFAHLFLFIIFALIWFIKLKIRLIFFIFARFLRQRKSFSFCRLYAFFFFFFFDAAMPSSFFSFLFLLRCFWYMFLFDARSTAIDRCDRPWCRSGGRSDPMVIRWERRRGARYALTRCERCLKSVLCKRLRFICSFMLI